MAEVSGSEPLAAYRSGPHHGIPLLLLHGFPLDALMWEDVVMRMPEIPVISVDAPGFGDSPSFADVAYAVGRPGARPSLEVVADAVAAVLAREGIHRAIPVGLSMGGYITLALAERHYSLLAGIGLLDTKSTADDAAARANRLRIADAAEGEAGSAAVAPMLDVLLGATTKTERPDLVAEVTGLLAAAPPAGIAWGQRAMAARPDRTEVLAALEVPALVLRGAEDVLSTQEAVETMAHRLSDVEVVVVPEAGHMTAMEQPDEVAEALKRLWERANA